MELNNDIIAKAVKSAFENSGVTSIPGIDVDDLIKSITESIMKSIDVKSIGSNLLGSIAKNIGSK